MKLKYFYGLLILLINIIATARGYSNIVIAILQLFLIILYYKQSVKYGSSFVTIMIELMCYTWSSSWRNIFGGSFAKIPVPWFYLIGFALFINTAIKRRFKVNAKDVALYYSLIAIPIIALLMSKSRSDGITQYITLLFTFIVGLAIKCSVKNVTPHEYKNVLDAYVNSITLVAIGITIQYISQAIFNVNIIKNSEAVLVGGDRLANALLFLDLSSATIFCYLAVLVILWNWDGTKYPVVKFLIIIIGTSFSSARTGVLALLAGFMLFILKGNHSVPKKVLLIFSAGIIGSIIIFTLNHVRNLDYSSESFDNGRFEGYLAALNIYKDHIFLGVGFGDDYLQNLMGMPVPHFSILKILVQTGIVFTLPLLIYLTQLFTITNRKLISRYLYFGLLVGSCVIPGLFSARFFVIIVGLIYMENSMIRSLKRKRVISVQNDSLNSETFIFRNLQYKINN